MRKRAQLTCYLALVLIISACGSNPFAPVPISQVPFLERAQTQSKDDIRVSTAVPSAAETVALFDANLYKRGIQPVWLKIENRSSKPVQFFSVGLDADYFTPIETSFLNQKKGARKSDIEMNRYYFDSGISHLIPAGETRTGFMFTRLDEGTKSFNVEIAGPDKLFLHFTFFVPVPGLRLDHSDTDFASMYSPEEIRDYSEAELMEALRSLPCCATDKDSEGQADPLNLVVIGSPMDVYYGFLKAGWDETETIYSGSSLKTVKSFVFGREYRYSPVSALYVYERGQDVAFQKARNTIHERNHLRLWMTPMTFQGKSVWIGQISRDIGVRFTKKTITTHKIDPDVDETREYLLEDLAYAQALDQVAYIGGVGAAPIDSPRGNLTGDPYFTDGYRVVLWVSEDPVAIDDIQYLEWVDMGRSQR
jgi:hypothetical protein